MAIAFFGMLLSSTQVLNVLGFFLVAAVLFDTFVVRTLLVPAVMSLIGRYNWWPIMPTAGGKGGGDLTSAVNRQDTTNARFDYPSEVHADPSGGLRNATSGGASADPRSRKLDAFAAPQQRSRIPSGSTVGGGDDLEQDRSMFADQLGPSPRGPRNSGLFYGAV